MNGNPLRVPVFRVRSEMRCLFFLPFCLLASCGFAKDETLPEDVAAEVMSAYQSEDYTKVVELTTDIPEDSKWKRVRGAAFQRRGMIRFFDEGKPKEAISDFDAFLELYPDEDPHHWQRGLAYYYAEEYEKGKAQFERHQTVNSRDVENAVWHFLCAVRAPGGSVESARKGFIDIEGDQRVPMKEIHSLFAGTGSEEGVLAAAKSSEGEFLSEKEKNHLCYAHLYLGLYFEAMGENEKSAEHIRKAAFEYPMEHPMGKTAQIHAKLRGIDEKAE